MKGTINYSTLNGFPTVELMVRYLSTFELTFEQTLLVLVNSDSITAGFILFKILTDDETKKLLGFENLALSRKDKKLLRKVNSMKFGGFIYELICLAAFNPSVRALRYKGKKIDYSDIDQSLFLEIIKDRREKAQAKDNSPKISKFKPKENPDSFGKNSLADIYDYGLSDW